MDQEIQYMGTNHSITYIRSNTPYKVFRLETQPPGTTRIYISAQLPTPDMGEAGDLWIHRKHAGFEPSTVELLWKGFRKDGVGTVWRTTQLNRTPVKIRHPLHRGLYLHGFPSSPLRPQWCKKKPQGQSQQNLNLSAVLFLRLHEAGCSSSNPIILSNRLHLTAPSSYQLSYGNGTPDDPIVLS